MARVEGVTRIVMESEGRQVMEGDHAGALVSHRKDLGFRPKIEMQWRV